MIVAAHQPNYMPWLGFLHKLRRCDLFLVYDHCQFERQGFQNRTRVRAGAGWRWLTVPVEHRGLEQPIHETRIANDRDGRLRWGRKHYLTLEQAYRAAPYFPRYAPELRELLVSRWDRLVDLNLALIRFCMDAFEIRTPLVRTSTLRLPPAETRGERVLALCKAVGADVYLSGEGASRSYVDEAAFAAAGVRVRWQGFRHPEYPQAQGRPLKGLCALDLLFNCGPDAARLLG